MEPASQLQAEDFESHEKAGRGWEFVDMNLEYPEGGTVLGVIDLWRIPDGSTSFQRWNSAMRAGPAAEGRSDGCQASK